MARILRSVEFESESAVELDAKCTFSPVTHWMPLSDRPETLESQGEHEQITPSRSIHLGNPSIEGVPPAPRVPGAGHPGHRPRPARRGLLRPARAGPRSGPREAGSPRAVPDGRCQPVPLIDCVIYPTTAPFACPRGSARRESIWLTLARRYREWTASATGGTRRR